MERSRAIGGGQVANQSRRGGIKPAAHLARTSCGGFSTRASSLPGELWSGRCEHQGWENGGGSGVDWKPVPRIGSDTVSNLPLSALVSQALVAFAMQYEELSPVAFSLSASVIGQIPAEGRRLQELGRSPGVAALIRHGFVDATGPSGREIASLTPRGLDVQRRYETRIQIVETSWQRQFGKDRVAALVGALQEAEVRQGSGEPG